MISIFTPRYAHRKVSMDERAGLKIQDTLYPEGAWPHECGDCGRKGTPASPLMMKPYFLMQDSVLPRGTLYQVRCTTCQEKRVRAGRLGAA